MAKSLQGGSENSGFWIDMDYTGVSCIENQEENGGRLGVKTVRASNVKMRANEAGQASNG